MFLLKIVLVIKCRSLVLNFHGYASIFIELPYERKYDF